MSALCLIPDAQFEGPADVEASVAGERLEFAVARAGSLLSFDRAVLDRAEACALWQQAEVDGAVLDRMPNCRIIARCGTGFDRIDLSEAGRRGIPVCNVPDYGTCEVADHAMAMALALIRGLNVYDRNIRAERIQGWNYALAPLVSRTRKRLFAVVGLGRIGTAVARRAKAFDYDVAFFDPYVCDGMDIALGIERVNSLEALAERAEILSIHTPLRQETHHLVGADLMARMKASAIIVNTARGPCLDVDTALDFLANGRIGGLALDVLEAEPPQSASTMARALVSDDPRLRDRLLVSPHAAFYSPDARFEMRARAIETILAYLTDGSLRNCVNREFLVGGVQ
ncbi:MAG: C-terminal binding protein [Mesorhizobium sp.]|nr:MAG: C-terminal binding protein [Mesorhizobium sp.]TIX28169.1 MAG: C-terminal binding protein [Mesorhizobium sp.]